MILRGLCFIALFTIGIRCDVIYFNNDTVTKLLYTAQMLNQQSCPMLDEGVIIALIGITEQTTTGCKGTRHIPVDKMVVKHLISQVNDDNVSTPLVYLYSDDGEFTDGHSDNISFSQRRCIWAQRDVIILRPKGAKINTNLTQLSLQMLLIAEYTYDCSVNDDYEERVFSITPDANTLVKAVSYFIMTTGWTRVGLLHDTTGARLSIKFKQELNMTLQVYQMKYDGTNANTVYSEYRSKNVRIILFTGLVRNYLQVLDDLYDYYYTGKG